MDVLFKTNDGNLQFDQSKEVCLLVRGDFPNQADLSMLKAMMGAINVDMGQVDVVSYKDPLDRIPNNFRIILLFGVVDGSLDNINFALNKPLQLEQSILMATYSLEELNEDKANKIKLWKSLQSTFL